MTINYTIDERFIIDPGETHTSFMNSSAKKWNLFWMWKRTTL